MMRNEFKVMLLIQNSLKAYIYLISWYMRDYSKLKDSKDIHAPAQRGRRKKNKELGENDAEIN